jgi:hypothetical protein
LSTNDITIKRTGLMDVSQNWSYNGKLKLTGGKLSMPDSSLILGNSGNTVLSFDSGEITANAIVVGPYCSMSSGSGAILTTNNISGNSFAFNGQLRLGRSGSSGTGSQILSNGSSFNLTSLMVGYGSADTFTINGGTLKVSNTLQIGGTGNGSVIVNGGTLNASSIVLGTAGAGTVNISDSSSVITVSTSLSIGANGSIIANPDSIIHMTGSIFDNKSSTPAALAGLLNIKMIFEGGSNHNDTFEIAGKDLGGVNEGLISNFALGTLQIGGANIGKIKLIDSFDNQPAWNGNESLYVTNLILGSGSTIDLNGLNLYYLNFTNLGGNVILNGGHLQTVPEPSSVLLFVMGFISLMCMVSKHPFSIYCRGTCNEA